MPRVVSKCCCLCCEGRKPPDTLTVTLHDCTGFYGGHGFNGLSTTLVVGNRENPLNSDPNVWSGDLFHTVYINNIRLSFQFTCIPAPNGWEDVSRYQICVWGFLHPSIYAYRWRCTLIPVPDPTMIVKVSCDPTHFEGHIVNLNGMNVRISPTESEWLVGDVLFSITE